MEHLVSQALLHVRIVKVFDVYALLDGIYALEAELAELAAAKPPSHGQRGRLIIVDGVAALFAPLIGTNMAAQGMMHVVAGGLQRLVGGHCRFCAGIITNSTVAGNPDCPAPQTPSDALWSLRPALGFSWSYQAVTRVALILAPSGDESGDARHGVAAVVKGFVRGDATAALPGYTISRSGFGDGPSRTPM
mmetsp:Transcript_20817/g.63343  ORF Transcript_20817/g.63343 Transcript_20817/m.63343 type:complete len:191 (-) Transcript_20817:943-1515(-)